jgi:hypothetical protein
MGINELTARVSGDVPKGSHTWREIWNTKIFLMKIRIRHKAKGCHRSVRAYTAR